MVFRFLFFFLQPIKWKYHELYYYKRNLNGNRSILQVLEHVVWLVFNQLNYKRLVHIIINRRWKHTPVQSGLFEWQGDYFHKGIGQTGWGGGIWFLLRREWQGEGMVGREEVERRPLQLFDHDLFQFQSWEVFVSNPITAIVGNRWCMSR